MVEIAISVAAKIAEYLVAPVARPFRYLWNYKTNLESLKNEVKKLEAKREDVQHSVEDARNNCEEIKKHVESWLEDVKKVIDEASAVGEDNHQQASMQCFKGFSCTKLMKRYQHSKKAAKLKAVVFQSSEEAGKFKKVSYPTIPEQACLQPSKGYQTFESRMSILKDVIDALSDSDVNMIGIYGMSGVGKTTLAKEVAKEAGRPKNGLPLFDKIIFVEVSESPDIKNIQGVVAENLGLQFTEEKTVSGRANKLYDWLKKEEKILLILDNIWGRIDFEKIGIPIENDRRGLKLLLTTRNRNVLTNQMDCQRNFEVDALNKADAWSLFTSIIGTFIEHPDLNSIAREVSDECGGIPIAIVAIAEALKGQGQNEWRNALRELKNPSSKSFGGITEEVYTSIKLSYDYLENEELKETFLLCSRMGCTYDASVQDLFRYGLGLGLFDKFDTMEEALCNVYVSVNKLKAASLLLDAPKSETIYDFDPCPDNERFAMHDIIYDVAKSIANVSVIDVAIPPPWTNENTLTNCTSITLHNIDELPEDLEPVCPQLKLLYVNPKDSSFRIPDNFFTRMLGLQVLHLIGINLQLLPTSISCLLDLQTLCLDRCKLGDMAVIGNLKKLKILSFCGSDIEKLPEEMRHLTKLRLLDLTYCYKLRVFPPNVMSNLKKLEALYMRYASIQWEVERPNIERSNFSIDELKHLHHLTMLEIHIPDAKMMKGLLSQKLEKYKIVIGDEREAWPWGYRYKTSRMLKLSLNTNEDENILQYMKGIEELVLGEVPGATNLLDALDRNGFPKLKHLDVDSNSQCSCIVESCDALPLLESLDVSKMEVLEKICNRPLGANSFLQLRTIRVGECHKLNNIFSSSAVTILPQLQEIEVSSCENMEEIFAIGGQDDANNTEVVHEIEFSQLRNLSLLSLSQLKSFCCEVKTDAPLQLTSDTQPREIVSEEEIDICTLLFDHKVAFPNLQTLHISKIPVEKIWQNLPPKISSCVQNLTVLNVSDCGNLKELFSSSMVVMEESREEGIMDTLLFPKLKYLYMRGLKKLTALWFGYYIEFPTLKEFRIENCPQMDALIFDDKVRFPSLEKMVISGMDNLESIWHNQFLGDSFSFSKLKSVEVNDCQELKTMFPSCICGRLSSLESLTVKSCGLVEEIFNLPWLNLKEKHSIEATTQLRELYVDHMSNLKRIWNKDPEGMLSYGKLQKVTVFLCPNLENLFPASVAKSLLNLVSLEVSDCGLLKEIIAKGGVKEAADRLLFPKLSSLQLHNLPQLRTFYTGKTVEVSCLKRLGLHHCDNVKLFISEFLGFYETIELEGTNQGLPNLEELQLSGKEITMKWLDQVLGDVFRSLKSLELNNLESTDLPLHFIQKFGSLGKLSLNSSAYKEIFSYGEVKERPQIKHLVLGGLFDLKQIWKDDSKIDLNFQKLEILEVRSSFNLINLMPSSASFQKLMILKVWGCDGLKNLLTSSTAKSLVLLEKLEVFDCKMLIDVVANEGTEEINFRKLKSLSLMYLQSLASFCSMKHTLTFPILESLVVNECPQMKIFSKRVTSTPKLHKLELNWKAFEQSWEVDVNTIIRQNMENRQEWHMPPKRGQIKVRILEEIIKSVAATSTTTASRESLEDNGGQQQWSTSPNSAGRAATLVGYNSDADVSES